MTGEILSLETAISLEKSKQIENLKKENKKQKEVLDKIKEMFKKEMHEDGCEFCIKLEKLLEDNNEEN
jgi:ubiquitin C-terminal hydrolase